MIYKCNSCYEVFTSYNAIKYHKRNNFHFPSSCSGLDLKKTFELLLEVIEYEEVLLRSATLDCMISCIQSFKRNFTILS